MRLNLTVCAILAGLALSGSSAESLTTIAADSPERAEEVASTSNRQDTNSPSSVIQSEYGADGLHMNFRGAPLNLVLNFLSEAAGFVINKQAAVRGNVEIWSKQPVTKDEAVELLGSVLKKNGYTMTRNGRILTVVSLDNVKTADTDIVVNTDPNSVAKSEEVQTQIIPVRYATAAQLVANLQPLLPTTATLSANEGANSLILIATKTDIKRVLRIVAALDSSLATSSSIKVVTLLYANAKDAADLVAKLFAPETSSQTSRGNMPDFSGGPPDAGFAGAPTPTGRTSTENNAATRHNAVVSKVVAVADERSNSVILNCPPDLFARIEKMLRSLDQPMIESTELRVFRLANADPAELAEQIAQLYSEQTTSKGDANDMPTMFPPGPMGSRGNVNAAGTDSDRPKKAGKVMAVADPRSSALVVSASKTVMPQIAKMIESLDSDSGKREIVSYFELRNADPQDIYQNLQELFNRSTAQMGNNNQNNFLGRNNPLTQRQMQSQQSSTSTTAAMGSGASSPGATGAASNRSAP